MAQKYDTSRRAGESLEQQYKRLAKVADQRLVRLEQLSSQEGYKNVTKYSYNKAMYDINRFNPGQRRFNTGTPVTAKGNVDTQKLQSKIKAMQAFLDKPTSSKTGIVTTYKKRAASTNASQGLNLSWQDYANYYESEYFKKASSKKNFESAQSLKAYAKMIQKDLDPEEIIEASEQNIRIDDDVFVDETIKNIAKEYGHELKTLAKTAAKTTSKSNKNLRKDVGTAKKVAQKARRAKTAAKIVKKVIL